MEETASDVKKFLKEYNDSPSPTSEFNLNPKIVGNYNLSRQDVATQVIDWVINYLEDRKCPYNLAVSIAKETARQIENSISEQQSKESPTSDGKLLNSLTLYNDAIKKLALLCKSYLEEVNEMELQPFPLAYMASVFAVKNKRRKMEDRHVIHHDLNLLLDLKNCPHHSYYAVFDGHSGVDAASYASAHLHLNIANHPDFLTDTPTAIAEAYKTTDQNFIKKCYEENIKSGTTAVCALFREKTVFLSWVGDSQAVLVKEGKPAIVTSPHKPDRDDERKRVEDLGGTIQFIGTYRVNGMLAVTRAIGDADHKPFISSEPEITVINLDGQEDFLILACDGLWDGVSPEDVVAALYYNLLENGQDDPVDTMAAKLVHQSKLQGSEDNITAIVIFLRDIKVIKEEAQAYIPNLSKSDFMMNFFEANGDEKPLNDMVMSTPISKPNVLEFNNSSIKKLKNTANVLSAAGLGDSFTDYVETYHASHLDKVCESSIQKVVAPETTALSELPTPPIDDVMASQQFEKICSANLAQKFELSSPQNSDSNSSINSPGIDVENFKEDLQIKNPSDIISEKDKNNLEDISPEEAIDIASTVVTNAIETAVKCISEKESDEIKVRASPQKLNPYAEPFVMKSFIPTENIECNFVDVSPSAPELSTVMADTNYGKNENKELTDIETSYNEIKNDVEITSCGSHVLEKAQESFSELTLASNELGVATTLQKPAQSEKYSEGSPMLDDMQITLVENSLFDFATPQKVSPLLMVKDYQMNTFSQQANDNLVNTESGEMQNLVDFLNNEGNEAEESVIEMISQDSVIEITDEKLSPLEEFLDKGKANLNPSTDNLISADAEAHTNLDILVHQNTQNIELVDISSDSANDSHTDCKPDSSETGISIESNTIVNELCVAAESSSVTDTSCASVQDGQGSPNSRQQPVLDEKEKHLPSDKIPEAAIILGGVSLPLLDDKEAAVLPSESSSVTDTSCASVQDDQGSPNSRQQPVLDEKEKPLPSDKIPEAAIILGGVSLPLLDDKEAAVLPSDHSEECQTETVAVDLQSLPVGIPEAEGVTEDVDSDSEKDGGWSYMKGNVVGEKCKSERPAKQETSKLKKEALKSSIDIKSKLKSTTNVDKNKKLLAEKKPLEVKSKMSKPMSTNSSRVAVDKPKVATSVAAKKQIPAAKTTTISSSKLSRPTTASRNAPVQNKSEVPASTSRIQTATKPTSSSTSRVKTNTGVSTTSTLATAKPLVKKQPTTQVTKSSTLSAARTTVNRPAASTIPNRALTTTRPATLQKTSLDVKPKQPNTTLRQTASSTLKKPEVKETKELANKQLNEKKSPLPKIASKGVASNASSTLKSSVSGISKATAKTRNVPPKSESVKDVPKTQISRLATRNNTQMKPTKDTSSKATVKNSSSFQKKAIQKTNQIVKDGDKKTDEVTPSEEEKLLREVNDVEIPTKELADNASVVDVQEKSPVENGHASESDEKVLKDDPVPNPIESLL